MSWTSSPLKYNWYNIMLTKDCVTNKRSEQLRVNHVIDACSILTNVLFYFERKLKSPSGNIFKNSSTNKPNAINCFKIF